MITIICPDCGKEQTAADEKEYIFCRYCGTKLIIGTPAAAQAPLSMPCEETEEDIFIESDRAPAADSAADSADEARREETETGDPEQEPEPDEEEERTPKAKLLILLAGLLLAGGLAAAYFFAIRPATVYNRAVSYLNAGKYAAAADLLDDLGSFRNAAELRDEALLKEAIEAIGQEKFEEAAAALERRSPEADRSEAEKAANAQVSVLIGQGKTEEALDAIRALNGVVTDVTDAVRSRYALLMAGDASRRAEAAALREAFPEELSDAAFLQETVGTRAAQLISAGDFASAAALLAEYEEVSIPEDPLISTYQELLEAEDERGLAELLVSFSEELGQRETAKEASREKLAGLLAEKRYEEAVSLYLILQDTFGTDALSAPLLSAMQEAAASDDLKTVNLLLDSFGGLVKSIADPLESEIAERIKDHYYDEALQLLAGITGSRYDTRPARYEIAQLLMEEETYAEAYTILSELRYYENSRELAKVCQFRMALAVAEQEELTLEEMTAAFDQMVSVREMEGAEEALTLLEKRFIDLITESEAPQEAAEAFRDRNSKMGGADALSELFLYALEKIPSLGGTDEETWRPVVTAEKVYLAGIRTLTAAFTDYGVSLAGNFRNFLNFLETGGSLAGGDTEALWEYRADLREMMTSDNYLLSLLAGTWRDSLGRALLTVSRTANGSYTFSVALPIPDVARAEKTVVDRVGFSLVDEDGDVAARICDISFLDYHTIEIFNAEDRQVYRLTR